MDHFPAVVLWICHLAVNVYNLNAMMADFALILTGCSGVVIIAYPDTYPALVSISAGLTYDQPTHSGYRIYRFTAGTGTISW